VDYVRAADGNQSIAEAVAERLDGVRFNSFVTSIKVDERVSTGTDDGSMDTDSIVVAVPLPLISTIEFEPPLVPALLEAIEILQMGTAAKIAVATRSTPPRFARHCRRATAWWWTGDGLEGATRPAVTGFAGSQAAINELGANWIDELRSSVPEVTPIGPVESVDWGEDPWSRGCYSAIGPGQEHVPAAFDDVGPVVWAGEHTRAGGTIDGAIASGDRAAGLVNQYLTTFLPTP